MIEPLDKRLGFFRKLRSRLVGLPFALAARFVKWEIHGQERLLACVEEHQRSGRGLITVSNHLSLFDDPLVFLPLLGMGSLTEWTKIWYSTACAANFNPTGDGLGARFVRGFFDVANMIYLSRTEKRGGEALQGNPLEELRARVDERLERHALCRSRALGADLDGYFAAFLTDGEQAATLGRPSAFDQAGLLEACVRADCGDWVHFFPEAGRSRDLSLRPARPGVGKVIHRTDATVIPICLYGTQEFLPVGALLPRLGRRVVISVGEPLSPRRLAALRAQPAGPATFQAVANLAMEGVADLRPATLRRYLGEEAAARLLAAESAAAFGPASATAAPPPAIQHRAA